MAGEPDTVKIEGCVYKIGLHGLVFIRLNGDWLKSTKSSREIKKAMGRRGDIRL